MLSDEMIAEIGEACGLGCKVAAAGYPCDMLWFDGNPTPFARAIEAEVRKKYDEHVLENLDALLDDAAAHIYPSDLKQCQQCECVVEVYSVRVGNPTERSVPLFSREQVVEALRTGGQHAE